MTASIIINNPGPETLIVGKDTILLRSIPTSKLDIILKYPTKLSMKAPRSLPSTISFFKTSQSTDCFFNSLPNTDVHRNADIHRNISPGILTSHPIFSPQSSAPHLTQYLLGWS
ncbi:hypothetical protein HYPSUDRAFT_585010 [Hypholoma sublateritium FD-334 SS-4]|uniref:Uncharacterized protein n=1 Tax=Hypholoma sublateritium (strain FD-334 SS-4) TaxID=945553 RepID=A0A0D2P4Q5_HYPSF|nr:hypothetical protein HYPSUDRAFT_585010 [Hypholoma sublateritium FD-334 SS-4]